MSGKREYISNLSSSFMQEGDGCYILKRAANRGYGGQDVL